MVTNTDAQAGTLANGYTYVSGTQSINYGTGFTAAGMQLNGGAALNGTRLRVTSAAQQGAATSAYFSTPVNVQSFTTNFSFQLTAANADGMAFVIQNQGLTAVGSAGGGLGYTGIPNSAAVKFDLYDNLGEGNNSTGLYTLGQSIAIPAIDLTPSGVNLHSGDIFNVQLVYDGSKLTLTITDASHPAQTFTTNWTVNIPAAVGGNTALVGFTGGTGGLTATQEIISWTYGTQANPAPTVTSVAPTSGTASGGTPITVTGTGFLAGATVSLGGTAATNVVVSSGTHDHGYHSSPCGGRGQRRGHQHGRSGWHLSQWLYLQSGGQSGPHGYKRRAHVRHGCGRNADNHHRHRLPGRSHSQPRGHGCY